MESGRMEAPELDDLGKEFLVEFNRVFSSQKFLQAAINLRSVIRDDHGNNLKFDDALEKRLFEENGKLREDFFLEDSGGGEINLKDQDNNVLIRFDKRILMLKVGEKIPDNLNEYIREKIILNSAIWVAKYNVIQNVQNRERENPQDFLGQIDTSSKNAIRHMVEAVNDKGKSVSFNLAAGPYSYQLDANFKINLREKIKEKRLEQLITHINKINEIYSGKNKLRRFLHRNQMRRLAKKMEEISKSNKSPNAKYNEALYTLSQAFNSRFSGPLSFFSKRFSTDGLLAKIQNNPNRYHSLRLMALTLQQFPIDTAEFEVMSNRNKRAAINKAVKNAEKIQLHISDKSYVNNSYQEVFPTLVIDAIAEKQSEDIKQELRERVHPSKE